MNIKRAKQEIKDTIEAYLLKDERGEYCIPSIRQRPVFLIGPPGIGKTQIMEQIARECKINLVSYTITHHTRQSAMGLPFIREKEYGGENRSVTEYTMSEIISAVYDKMKETGIEEGILFIDEINCVSETLAPAMLQFLQCKTFGNQQVPKGWVIVTAGNPPEYNKSVREFDVVTLDRIKKIEVQENFSVWKEYAYEAGIHPAVISYLDIRKENFYRMETSVNGRMFATARGWEDLSELLYVYEKLGKTVDREVIMQYIQHWKIAKDFANYLELFEKYQTDYQIDAVLAGTFASFAVEKLRVAAFDERFSVVGLLIGKLNEKFRNYHDNEVYMEMLFELLKNWKEALLDERKASVSMGDILDMENQALEEKKVAGQLTKEAEYIWLRVIECFRDYKETADTLDIVGESKEVIFDAVKERFQEEKEKREKDIETLHDNLQNAFDFLEAAFADGQEMVIFVTELNTSPYSLEFISEYGCDSYYKYNKKLLFHEEYTEILDELNEIEQEL